MDLRDTLGLTRHFLDEETESQEVTFLGQLLTRLFSLLTFIRSLISSFLSIMFVHAYYTTVS